MPVATPPPRPPMSTSSLSGSMKPFPVQPGRIKPPVLASDMLREEVAPRAPAQRAVRLALFVATATFAAGSLAARGMLGPVHLEAPLAFEAAAVVALVSAAATALPLPYAAKAWVATLAGAAPLVLASAHLGPMAALGDEGFFAATAFAVMATALPAALVFRARYRAYRGARTVLAIALVLSLPAVAALASSALSVQSDLAIRVLSCVAIGGAAASSLGFMGAETSAGCAQWAAIVVGALVARPTERAFVAAWTGQDGRMIAGTAAALGELVASTLVTFALFQLLAAAFGGRARQVDVHRAVGAGASDPSLSSSENGKSPAND